MKYLKYINEFFLYGDSPSSDVTYRNNTLKKWYDEFELEFSEKYTDENWKRVLETLERDCGQFLEELKSSKSDPLFRGVRTLNGGKDGIVLKNTRKDRYPKDLSWNVSKEFDRLFQDKFGLPIRSQGVFATKDAISSSGYGKYNPIKKRSISYLFFPKGNYSYYWNPKIKDLYNDVEDEDWYWFFDDFESSLESYLSDKWWIEYGDPARRMNDCNWLRFGGGKGQYFYQDKPTGENLRIRAISKIKEEYDIEMSDEEVIRKLEWVPEKSFSDFSEEYISKSKENADRGIIEIVGGYQDNNIQDAQEQEITFICDQYYLVDEAYLHKIEEYLKSK
jgi:predicted CopG family antitoxin